MKPHFRRPTKTPSPQGQVAAVRAQLEKSQEEVRDQRETLDQLNNIVAEFPDELSGAHSACPPRSAPAKIP